MTKFLKIISVAAIFIVLCALAFLLFTPKETDVEPENQAFLSGRAIDAITARPVPYAEIIASNPSNNQKYSVKSDRNGYFELHLKAGRHTLEGQKDGYVEGRKRSIHPENGVRYINIAVKMLKMSALSGQVVDGDNHDAAAELSLRCDDGHAQKLHAVGSFSFERLVRTTCRLTVKSPEHVSVVLDNIDIADASTTEIPTIRLQKSLTLRGKVRDAWTKKGIEGVKVTASDDVSETYSDAQGFYTVDLNPQQKNSLVFSKKGYGNAYFDVDARKIYDIELKADNKILVRVLRDVERQHTQCLISAHEQNSDKIVETRPENDVAILPADDGIHTVTLKAREESWHAFKDEIVEHNALPGDVVVFRLNRLAAVTIDIKKNSMPVGTGFHALARVRNNKISDSVYSAPGAFFSDNAMPEGSYRFSYRESEHAPPVFERDFTLAPGDERVFEWEIDTAQELTSFTGFIADSDGRPLAKVAVYYNDPESGNPDDPDGDLMLVYTDADGYFEIENLPLRYRFSVYVVKDEDNIQIYTNLLSGGSRDFIFTGNL